MKILIAVLISMLCSSFAFASQYFHCQNQSGSVISILIKNYSTIEYETDWDVDGPYELTSYKAEMWTTFMSAENPGVMIQIQGKMFNGKSGYLKQVFHHYGLEAPYVSMFFCRPGKSKFFPGLDL